MTEIIEGEAHEVPEERALVPVQPGQSLVTAATAQGPGNMISMATALATALKDIVERQRLYATINGRKYPQVEAWMTVARMDNVVAREVIGGVFRHEDGAYEGTVELVRLSDGMVIGRGSALCGTTGDSPWDKRSEPARRSMAVTRATSRAFRQQYSWIMALAGYEPTPAEEMRDDAPPATPAATGDGGIIGAVDVKPEWLKDLELRQTPVGPAIGFRLKQGRQYQNVQAIGPIAEAIAAIPALAGVTVTCWGKWVGEEFTPKGMTRPVPYQVLRLERLHGPTFDVPPTDATPEPEPAPDGAVGLTEAESEALWEELDRIKA